LKKRADYLTDNNFCQDKIYCRAAQSEKPVSQNPLGVGALHDNPH
jgi:hypothetical protein